MDINFVAIRNTDEYYLQEKMLLEEKLILLTYEQKLKNRMLELCQSDIEKKNLFFSREANKSRQKYFKSVFKSLEEKIELLSELTKNNEKTNVLIVLDELEQLLKNLKKENGHYYEEKKIEISAMAKESDEIITNAYKKHLTNSAFNLSNDEVLLNQCDETTRKEYKKIKNLIKNYTKTN